jgi:hypothetical protein
MVFIKYTAYFKIQTGYFVRKAYAFCKIPEQTAIIPTVALTDRPFECSQYICCAVGNFFI